MVSSFGGVPCLFANREDTIVQAIAHAHGGQATLESQPGHGTKVRVWLPARTLPQPGATSPGGSRADM